MVNKTKIDVVQNDYGYNLDMKLEDASGDAVNLTTVGTVTFTAGIINSGTKVNGTCSVISAADGSVRYLVGTTDFTDADKTYQCEVAANWGTKLVTARGLTIHVLGDLPETG
jgi:hypothetical protein